MKIHLLYQYKMIVRRTWSLKHTAYSHIKTRRKIHKSTNLHLINYYYNLISIIWIFAPSFSETLWMGSLLREESLEGKKIFFHNPDHRNSCLTLTNLKTFLKKAGLVELWTGNTLWTHFYWTSCQCSVEFYYK